MEHLMTSEEVAEVLHVDPVTIRRLVNRNELAAYRIGADFRFAPSDLKDYLQRQRVPASAEAQSTANALDQFTQWLRKMLQSKHISPRELVADSRFNRFSDAARQALTLLAPEEARRFKHPFIGTEHLLLALTRQEEAVAAQVLQHLGIEPGRVREAVEDILRQGDLLIRGDAANAIDNPGLTNRARKVLELAVDEARRLQHQYIGTEHLLLGLLREGEGVAASVLESLNVQLREVRNETLQILSQRQSMPQRPPAVPEAAATLFPADDPALVCNNCGARCPDYFQYCFNCGQHLLTEQKQQG